MKTPTSHTRSTGKGGNILCLHSSLGSSKQWLSLMDRLQGSFCITAADLYGYGKTPEWNGVETFSLNHELALLAPIVDSMKGSIHLVGHSYGAAVALKLAQKYTHKICSLTVYEPVLFSLLFALESRRQVASDISSLINDMQALYNAGHADKATRRFINYWSGEGSWEKFCSRQQMAMIEKISVVLNNFEAIVAEPNLLPDLKQLNKPVLCLYGEDSPSSTVEVSQVLAQLLPVSSLRSLANIGHMGPVTHSDLVNQQIEAFIRSQSAGLSRQKIPVTTSVAA